MDASPSKCVHICCVMFLFVLLFTLPKTDVRALHLFTLPSIQPSYSWGDIWVIAEALCFYMYTVNQLQESKVHMVICENNVGYLKCTVRNCNISVLTKITDFDVTCAQIRVE